MITDGNLRIISQILSFPNSSLINFIIKFIILNKILQPYFIPHISMSSNIVKLVED